MMRLNPLLHNLPVLNTHQDCDIQGLSQDSRTLQPGDLFFAYPGTQTDGRHYIKEAIAKGAAAILMESTMPSSLPSHRSLPPILILPKLKHYISDIAARFYGYPHQDMTLIGVTGTNGKSSCTHFIATCLANVGQPCGIIGSITHGVYSPSHNGAAFTPLQSSRLTTPDAIELQQLLAQFKEQGIRRVVLEISSHGLAQGRIKALPLTIAGFTNLTHDHLDYHGTMEAYAETKKTLFKQPHLQYAIFNQDDPYGAAWKEAFHNSLSAYGYTTSHSISGVLPINTCHATVQQADQRGLSAHLLTPWGKRTLTNDSLMGAFNLSNLLLVFCTLGILEIPLQGIIDAISQLKPVTGRMEKLGGTGKKPLVIVDYAHTPDALQKALQALHTPQGTLWCIFGCGGNRDARKRPVMGKIAEQYADRVVITDDNPRHEASRSIIRSILWGMHHPYKAIVIPDRSQAILKTISTAQPEDTILIAGKGHETYQIIQGVSHSFSDHRIVQAALRDKQK